MRLAAPRVRPFAVLLLVALLALAVGQTSQRPAPLAAAGLDPSFAPLTIAERLGPPEGETPPVLGAAPASQVTDIDRQRQAVIAYAEALMATISGDFEQALRRYADARDLYRQAGDAAGEASALDGAAGIHERRGEYLAAIAVREEALAVARAGGAQTEVAVALKGLSQLAYRLGQYGRARELAEASLAVARAQRRDAREAGERLAELNAQSAESLALAALGLALAALGDYAGALSAHFARLAIVRERLALAEEGEEGVSLTASQLALHQVLNSLGSVHAALGRHDRALEYFAQALRGAAETGDAGAVLIYQNNAALTLVELGQAEVAGALFEEALGLARALRDRSSERVILNNHGNLLVEQGEAVRALVLFERSLAIARDLGDRNGEGASLNSIGAVRLRTEDAITAAGAFAQALAIARETGNRALEVTTLTNLAAATARSGDLEAALALDLEAVGVAEDIRSLARVDELKSGAAGLAEAAYAHAVELLVRLNRVEEAFAISERGRARSFLDQLGSERGRLMTGVSPALAAEEERLRTEIAALDLQVRGLLARQQSRTVRERLEALRPELDARRRAYEDLLLRLRLESLPAAALAEVAPSTAAEVRARLTPGSALVSYFTTPGHSYAFILTADRLRVVRIDATREELRRANEEFRDFTSVRSQPLPPPALVRLHQWLIVPLGDDLPEELVIVPHGVLAYVPFAALSDGQTYLGEWHTLSHLPSASALTMLAQGRRPLAGPHLIAAQSRAESLPPLRYADQEAEEIAQLLGSEPLTGARATESAVKAAAEQASVLHLAAHGELNPRAPLFSRIFLEPDGGDDGSLSVQDVYGLRMARATLVVLSACESQLGVESGGDDIIGLNRAFLYAGAPSVVASLWSVNDRATAALMTAFYRRLAAGESKAAALRGAQAETRAQFPHPFYWASFTLTGDAGR